MEHKENIYLNDSPAVSEGGAVAKAKPFNSYSCDVCLKDFVKLSNVIRHKKNVHSAGKAVRTDGKYRCRVCNANFIHPSSRRRHEKTRHDFHPDRKQELKCSECLSVFRTRKDIQVHIEEIHPDVTIESKSMIFRTMEEFVLWKETMQRDTVSFYCISNSFDIKDYVVHKYVCNRNGTFQSKSKNIRRLKMQGSSKTGFFCPAMLQVKIPSVEGKEITVHFTATHMGHECKIEHLRPSKKKEITGPNHANIPGELIVEKISDAVSPQDISGCSFNFCDLRIELLYQGPKEENNEELEQLKQKAVSALIAMIPKVDEFTTESQCKELIESLSVSENFIDNKW